MLTVWPRENPLRYIPPTKKRGHTLWVLRLFARATLLRMAVACLPVRQRTSPTASPSRSWVTRCRVPNVVGSIRSSGSRISGVTFDGRPVASEGDLPPDQVIEQWRELHKTPTVGSSKAAVAANLLRLRKAMGLPEPAPSNGFGYDGGSSG